MAGGVEVHAPGTVGIKGVVWLDLFGCGFGLGCWCKCGVGASASLSVWGGEGVGVCMQECFRTVCVCVFVCVEPAGEEACLLQDAACIHGRFARHAYVLYNASY
jgi:hypothetical protein